MPNTRAIAVMLCGMLILGSWMRRWSAAASTVAAPAESGADSSALPPVLEPLKDAVVTIAAFDKGGQLTGIGHAFFVSSDGKLVVPRAMIENAASAIARTHDGRTYTLSDAYVSSKAPNAVVMQVDARGVPFFRNASADAPRENSRVTAIMNPEDRSAAVLLQATVLEKRKTAEGEWVSVEPAFPNSALGAPVVDDKGALLGFVGQSESSGRTALFSPSGGGADLLAQVRSEPLLVIERPPEPPAVSRASPEQSPRASPAPVAATASPLMARKRRLLFSPQPPYPRKFAWTYWDLRAAGVYRIRFDEKGRAARVQVARSSGYSELDNAALTTLRSWRAEPGAQWELSVPITFRQ